MKRVIPDGAAIKQLRTQLERLSTQKEMANEIAVSIRMLRRIETENAPVSVILLDRIAKLLGVHRNVVTLSLASSTTVVESEPPATALAELDKEQLIPRHDWDLAEATSDGGKLYEEASRSHDITCIIETPLSDETGACAQELFEILTNLTWSRRNILEHIAPSEQIATLRRIRQLIVTLRGNDIWIYQTSVLRRMPERFDLAPDDEPVRYQTRFVVALGPPGEYGETSMRVPIDHGQPFILPALKEIVSTRTTAC